MQRTPAGILRSFFDPQFGRRDRLIPRWLLLRALALIYFSAFYSLICQVRGLVGPDGILPARQFLDAVHHALGPARFWYAPTLYWINSSNSAIMAVCWIGLLASIAAFFNAWPRLSFFVCFVCYLSFVAAAGDFSGYQSDGMLLEAGFLALFFAPAGLWPGLGANSPPSRASYFLLQWEWFRIYFESGIVKLLSGDQRMAPPHRDGRVLPERPAAHLDRLVRPASAALVPGRHRWCEPSCLRLAIVFLMFLPRRARLICFLIVTPWEIGSNPHRELHLPELSRARARHSPARRRLSPQIRASAVFFCKAVANQFRTGNTGS